MQTKFGKRGLLSVLGIGGAATAITVAVLLVPQRGVTAPAKARPSVIVLANLSGDEHASFEYGAQGCFGGSAYHFEYAPTPTPHVTVTLPRTAGSTARPMGTVILTADQVRRFDSTLQFFRRHDRAGGCTTRTTLKVTLYRDGAKVATESREDGTCQRDLREDAFMEDVKALQQYPKIKPFVVDTTPILSLSRVISLAEKANQEKRASIAYTPRPRELTGAYQNLKFYRRIDTDKRLGGQAVLTLPGYSEMCRQFTVKDATFGSFNSFPYSLHVSLTSTTPRLVNAAWWFDPAEGTKPRYTWKQFLQVYQAVEKAVARHDWVKQWKNRGLGRSVDAEVFGVTAITEGKPERYVVPAWKHAGFKGMPRYEVRLRRNRDGWITVYFGDQDERALVLDAEPPQYPSHKDKSPLWLDNLKVSYYPGDAVPQYVTVTPDGTWRRNKRPDTRTPSWFRALKD